MRPWWALLLLLGCSTAAPQPSSAGKFVVTCLNVRDVDRGSGLAIVLQTPGGKTFLYDTGNGYPSKERPGEWDGDYNCGRDDILPFLRQRGIVALDGVFISHAHYDHFGGLLWLTDHFPIRKLYDCGYEYSGADTGTSAGELEQYSYLRSLFKKRRAYQQALLGDRLALDDALEIEVIAPPKGFFGVVAPEKRAKNDGPAHFLVNANSLMLRIRHGSLVFLFPGDIQDIDQREQLLPLVPAEKLKCHVLIAPGHGIHAVPEFAQAARPEVTICSAIPKYAKVSPSPKVYGAVGSKVYLTGLHGRVTVTSDGASYTATAEREP